jgi:hypothetical protein
MKLRPAPAAADRRPHLRYRLRFVLAGGYAIQAHDLVSRVSQDLDLATNTAAGMDEIVQALAAGLRDSGWGISITEIAPRMAA